MKVLAADTATEYCSVALCSFLEHDAHVLSESTVRAGRRHSELLLQMTQEVLQQAGSSLDEVDLLAISAGPGSFTGLRVGVSTWKGLALGAQKPLMAVPTLDALALRWREPERVVCPVLDARMSEVFAAAYAFRMGVRTELTPAFVASIESALEHIPQESVVLGDGVLRYRETIESLRPDIEIAGPEFHAPDAVQIAIEGASRVREGHESDPATANPVYLRKTYAEPKRRKAQGAAP